MSHMPNGRRLLAPAAMMAFAVSMACGDGSREERAERLDAALETSLAPDSGPNQRNGIAAAILIDVSRSMAEETGSPSEAKIVAARRAAIEVVEQFARYAEERARRDQRRPACGMS